ncbi:phosphoethanolamine transferase [Methylibium sp.]|uniref:phosphoethanolamine transferase n=1 Tax=Methylibium sp. TaxID=2067992 RepID=UPI003D131798
MSLPYPLSRLPALARGRTAPDNTQPARDRSPLALIWLCALWIAGPANWPLWRAFIDLPDLTGGRGVLFGIAFGLMIAALTAALLSLLAWRHALKPAITLLLVTAAASAHFMGSYGIVIDPTMMLNVMGTDPRETRDLLSVPLFGSLLLLAALPLWWVWRLPVDYRPWPARAARNALGLIGALALLVAMTLLSFQDLSGTMRNHKELRYLVNPLNVFYSLGRVAYAAQARPAGPPLPIGLDARPAAPLPGQRTPLLLLVVGETARADHFALNGYDRDTNPELRALGVLSFRSVTSCGTNTAASLPCMVSHLGRTAHEARDHDHENLLDLLQRAGLAVLWIENQAGCKGVCERVPHTRPELPAPGATPPDATLCPRGECLDEAMLHGLDQRLAALPADKRARGVVLVMHQMGSHGPAYSQRSPADRKRFEPECTSNVLQQCDHQQLVNAYDNSIAYTDHVLARASAWLQQQTTGYDPALLYLSDHGESLGENNIYLHGLPFSIAPREQTQVPLIAWLPAQRLQADRLDLRCLRGRLDTALSHDNLFHTVLGLARVQASEYRSALDILAPCRAAS